MDGHPKWTRETTWRQGLVLDAEAAAAAGIIVDDSTCAVVIGHDCDLANDNLEVEPNVEVVVGRLVPAANGNFCWGKNPRTLHLTMTRDGIQVIVELVTNEKRNVAKRVLAGFKPNEAFALDGKELGVLRSWLAARYNRAAFPDSFVDRMRMTKLDESLAKIIAPSAKLISFVYFDLDGGRVIECEQGDPHDLSIVLVYSPGVDPEQDAENTAELANSIRDAFDRKLTQEGIISLKSCFAISEDDVPVSRVRTLLQWRLEFMTLRAVDEQPGPPPI